MAANRIFKDLFYHGNEKNIQISFSGVDPAEARFFHNNIIGQRPGQKVFRYKSAYTLKDFERKFSKHAGGNIQAHPRFVDPDKGDFRLKADSPCIDAGGPLTKTHSAGRGKVIEVRDALFFSDGHGIVEADLIRVGTERVRVVKVDYDRRRITVEERLTWKAGAPVSLDYAGKAPDMGAFEFGYQKPGASGRR